MAATPSVTGSVWKVFSQDGEYRASVRYPEDAARLLTGLGDGTTLRFGHAKSGIVWNQSCLEHAPAHLRQPVLVSGITYGDAGESFDLVAEAAYAYKRKLDARLYENVTELGG